MLIKRLTVTLPSEALKTRMEKGRSTEKKKLKKRMKIVDGWQKTEQRTWTVSKFCLEQMMHSFWVVDKSWAVSLIHFNKESLRMGSKIIVLDRQRRIKINLQNCLFCFLRTFVSISSGGLHCQKWYYQWVQLENRALMSAKNVVSLLYLFFSYFFSPANPLTTS